MLDCAEVLLNTMFSGLREGRTWFLTSIFPEALINIFPDLILRNLRSEFILQAAVALQVFYLFLQ
ncbi:conserved hypothetical protein [Methanosarcina thermophila]|jgi:hypothetical protein|uniref:Uncharacterized protein n=1 Tax=Methanosarcina thermophila TaxID=2210 RepID=A0A3G9CRS1_METTE|nr:conserved hypothetical protein [Methanosarcina thermophila]